MQQDEFASRLRTLEEQLEKDLELIREAHRAKVRALEELRSAAAGELSRPTPSRPSNPAPVPAAVVRKPPGQIAYALEEAWDQVPAEFDKRDLYRVLGHQPSRATLDRAINDLLLAKKIVVRQASDGRHLTKYGKVESG